jgi:predicted nuclease with RNAse H fold
MRAAGVDVGLRTLDLVLLDETRAVLAVHGRLVPESLATVIADLDPDVVAIDSPPRWAPACGRATERELRRRNIQMYATPLELKLSPKGFHDWMKTGQAAFRALEGKFPLFEGNGFEDTAIEVFPHATAVVLAGQRSPRGARKHEWRREILRGQGVETAELRSPDLVDAALAALTGLRALEGKAAWFGQPCEGVIVLPRPPEEIGAWYSAPDATPVCSCGACGWRNPRGSNFCSQCGRPLAAGR